MLTLIKYLTPILISTALSFSSQAEEVAITIDWKTLNKEGQKLVENQPILTEETKVILKYYFSLLKENGTLDERTNYYFNDLFIRENIDIEGINRLRDDYNKSMTTLTRDFDNQNVIIAGFPVPIDFDKNMRATRLLLVPVAGACIHVPPPPANQIIDISFPNGVIVESIYDPVWVEGRIKSNFTKSEVYLVDGVSDISIGYEMSGKQFKKY
ncbi:DUF3299 domain-containing protein [Vibrio crassostreae]|uniref:DUF3299 domain-containing protein n=1 Tax=Vibrio crassostreae TaxID=246167 RepID=UPI00200B292D|nr:DUF3299 domain-containing protein [Vibrio crassostreae]UPR31038.1 DUF3299 domain-containing protein [Vibrio crassostreae]